MLLWCKRISESRSKGEYNFVEELIKELINSFKSFAFSSYFFLFYFFLFSFLFSY